MRRTIGWVGAVAAAMTTAACSETTSPATSAELAQAFASVPAAFNLNTSSFAVGADSVAGAFVPEGRGGRGGRGGHRGPGGGGRGGLMGGGLGADFLGGVGFGRGFGHGPFGFGRGLFGVGSMPSECTFTAASGRVVCPEATSHGLTIARSAAYRNAAGDVQQAVDSTTNSVNVQIRVTGTVTRRDSATSVVEHESERTVTGLAAGATGRTVNGAARGTETTTGTNADGAFTAVRVVGDTARDVVVPIESGRHTFPTSGTVIREMTVTVTPASGTPTTATRREVITYAGDAGATIVVTQNGESRTCTITRDRGPRSCE
jgi:hypothetical protein